MAETRTRYLQTKPGAFVTLSEVKSTGQTSTTVPGTSAWTHMSFDSGTRILTLTPHVNDIRDYLYVGYMFRLSGATPADTNFYTIEAVLSSTSIRSVETPPASATGGTVSFYYPSGALMTGFDNTGRILLAAHTTVQGCLNTLDAQVNTNTANISTNTSNIATLTTRTPTYYNSSGQISNPKVWVGRVTNSGGANNVTVNYSSAGFSAVTNIQITVERNTSTLADVPLISLRSYTTTSCIVQFVESAGILLGGQGLEFATSTAISAHITVTGT